MWFQPLHFFPLRYLRIDTSVLTPQYCSIDTSVLQYCHLSIAVLIPQYCSIDTSVLQYQYLSILSSLQSVLQYCQPSASELSSLKITQQLPQPLA